MKVSVIVTTYNSLGYLSRVLDSLYIQTRLPDEVIVADDGSSPPTGEFVRATAHKSPFRLSHVWHEDMGFRAARIRNEAVKESTGDYLVFLDGDCLVSRHFVSDHIRLSHRGLFVQGKRVIVNRRASTDITPGQVNSAWSLARLVFMRGISNSHHILRIPAFPGSVSVSHRGIKTCNMGVHRDDFYSVNGFNERFVGWGREDSEFAARLYNFGLRRLSHPFMAICFHLWHEESDRSGLGRNDTMLQEAMESESYRCEDGINRG